MSFRAVLTGGPPELEGRRVLCPGKTQEKIRAHPRRGIIWDAATELPHAVYVPTDEVVEDAQVFVFAPELSRQTGFGRQRPEVEIPVEDRPIVDRLRDAWHAFQGRAR